MTDQPNSPTSVSALASTPGPWKIEGDEGLLSVAMGHGRAWMHFNPSVSSFGYDAVPEMRANAHLIAAAPDHALIGWAMCVQDGTWEEWGPGKGEFCFCGMRYATSLDQFGCPVLTDALRAAITKAQQS